MSLSRYMSRARGYFDQLLDSIGKKEPLQMVTEITIVQRYFTRAINESGKVIYPVEKKVVKQTTETILVNGTQTMRGEQVTKTFDMNGKVLTELKENLDK